MNTKYAFLFPGQGSQFIGMGKELAQNFAVAKQTFEEVDDTLNQKLSSLMFDGDIETLTQTQNAQPAIMAVSVATWRVLTTESNIKEKVACVAGHSLGEYSALCASGALNLNQTTKLLKVRANAMHQATQKNAGGMLALLGATIDQANELCKKSDCYIANDNCPGQIVLSGLLSNLTSAKIQAEQMGLKRVIPLAVSGAFHSPLMASAVEELNQALQDTQFNTPEIPIYFNVLANVQNDAQQFSDLLLKQLTQSVRWRETIQNIPCENFIECGPGKVLSGLVKRTKDAVQIQDTNTLDAIKKILQAEQ
jgi:[acyl-carrier-protein] S-malonyltransferase